METHPLQQIRADPAGEMSMEDLLSALSDYLLQSGFQNYMPYDLPEGEQTLEALRQAIEQALLDGERFDEDMRARLQQMQMDARSMIDRKTHRTHAAGRLLSPSKTLRIRPAVFHRGQVGEGQQQTKFEIPQEPRFLGYKALRDLLGSLGSQASDATTRVTWQPELKPAGRQSIRVWRYLESRHYGDPLQRHPARRVQLPLNIEYSDLNVHQCEYQSSCATVLMLDCSHSMILYGEDRFTRPRSGHGAVAADPDAVSGDSLVAGFVS